MKKRSVLLLAVAAMLAVLAMIGYHYRLQLLVFAAPRLTALQDPILPNQPIAWRTGPAQAAVPADARPPNIVVILADDMGFNDISFYNGAAASLKTPRIDSIAKNGVAFPNGYASNAVCAPSRAAILTGRYSTRFGFEYTPFMKIGVTIFDWMQQQNHTALPATFDYGHLHELPEMAEMGMPASEITIAETLKAAGYHTVHIGKWHLGGVGDMRPERQGFDESLYMASGLYLPEDSKDAVNAKLDFSGIDKMVWASMRYAAAFNGSEKFEPDGYLTDYYTDEAVKVIEANRNRPFFLYLAHWGVHNPLQASRDDFDALEHIEDRTLRVYAAMIRALDRGVGRVLDALAEHGLADNTLLIFTSDNGGAGYLGLPNINQPYRGWKLTLFEGGVHVPFLAQWPKRIAPGTRFAHPVSHMDIFATATMAAGGEIPADRTIDGVDLIPFLSGERNGPPHEILFWRQGHHQVVLHRGLKLIVSEFEHKRWLFDLNEDPTEQRNLAPTQPEQVAMLERLLAEHNAKQAEPLWPSVINAPQLVDKTEAETYEEGDEYVYWPN